MDIWTTSMRRRPNSECWEAMGPRVAAGPLQERGAWECHCSCSPSPPSGWRSSCKITRACSQLHCLEPFPENKGSMQEQWGHHKHLASLLGLSSLEDHWLRWHKLLLVLVSFPKPKPRSLLHGTTFSTKTREHDLIEKAVELREHSRDCGDSLGERNWGVPLFIPSSTFKGQVGALSRCSGLHARSP